MRLKMQNYEDYEDCPYCDSEEFELDQNYDDYETGIMGLPE